MTVKDPLSGAKYVGKRRELLTIGPGHQKARWEGVTGAVTQHNCSSKKILHWPIEGETNGVADLKWQKL